MQKNRNINEDGYEATFNNNTNQNEWPTVYPIGDVPPSLTGLFSPNILTEKESAVKSKRKK